MTRPSGPPKPLRRLRVDAVATGAVPLSAEQARYLLRVLRLQPGEPVELFDGEGRRGLGPIVERDEEVAVEIEAVEVDPQPPFVLTVAAAAPKGDRADWLVEKVAELGASELQWVECSRSVVKLSPGSKKLERFRRIADSAARQSGQSFTLAVHDRVAFDAFLERDFDHKWIAHPGGSRLAPSPGAGSGAVLIGPEGGFAPDEVSRAERAGYTTLGLGSTVLRVETAAVAATVLLMTAAHTEAGD